MSMREITDIDRLMRINDSLISRVGQSQDSADDAFSLFQTTHGTTTHGIEARLRRHTHELRSAMRRLEQSNVELATAKEIAEQANLSKTRFLAAASHDVLQPLNAAHLSISALADIQSTAEGKQLVAQVERALSTMDDLLRALLDISRLDAGVVQPEVGDVALMPVLESLQSDFQPIASSRGLTLRIRPTGLAVRSDRTMLRRILQNLIANALRYTVSGGVLVGAQVRGDNAVVTVADTGIGIPPDQSGIIYEEFRRASNANDRDRAGMDAGMGLGLAIVRRLITALDHQLSFSSKLGRGTVFRLAMPQAEMAPRPSAGTVPARPEPGYGLFGMNILVIEDDAEIRDAMDTLLRRWNCAVQLARTTGQALAAARTGTPDLIIADQHLAAGELGIDTIGRLRELSGRPIPALLVTADPSADIVSQTRRMGIEAMRKPVKPAELRALMAHLLA